MQSESQRTAAMERQRLGREPEGVEAQPVPDTYEAMNLIAEQTNRAELLIDIITDLTDLQLLDLIDSALIGAKANRDTVERIRRSAYVWGQALAEKEGA